MGSLPDVSLSGGEVPGVTSREGGEGRKKELNSLSGPILVGMAMDCGFAGVRLYGLHILFSSSAPSLHSHLGEVVRSRQPPKSECGADKWQAATVQLCLWHAASCACARYTEVKTT